MSKVTYAIVRIETDTDVNEILEDIQKLERRSPRCMIETYFVRDVNEQIEDDMPILYWP